MSALYGTLGGDGRSGERTRCAHHHTYAAARAWHGSITVTIFHDGDGPDVATIEVGEGSRVGGRELWRGPLADLLRANALRVAE